MPPSFPALPPSLPANAGGRAGAVAIGQCTAVGPGAGALPAGAHPAGGSLRPASREDPASQERCASRTLLGLLRADPPAAKAGRVDDGSPPSSTGAAASTQGASLNVPNWQSHRQWRWPRLAAALCAGGLAAVALSLLIPGAGDRAERPAPSPASTRAAVASTSGGESHEPNAAEAGAEPVRPLADAVATPPEAEARGVLAPVVAMDETLSDDALATLFEFEERAELPSCAERLKTLPEPHGGKRLGRSLEQLRAARRSLMRGNQDEAYTLLCSATAHYAANPPAWQELAQLALELGDPERAAWAIEQSLEHGGGSRALTGLRGDVAARLGRLERARTLWRESSSRRGQAPSDEGLVRRFLATADRQLRAFDVPGALIHYRRASILGAGGEAATRGMSVALERLGPSDAARAWGDRARGAFPER